MRILHLSDVHVPVPLSAIPARDWLSKRAIGGLNYLVRRGPRFVHAVEKLASLARFAEEERVDLVICSGDFTVLGTEPEHAAAARAIEPLTKRPLGFFSVPGNHDVYLSDSVRAQRFMRHFEPLNRLPEGADELPSLATDGLYPRVRRYPGDVAVLGIESARPNPQPWRSSGRIPERQLEGLRTALMHPAIASSFKIVVTHYAPRLASGRPDSESHGLENADALLEILRPHARTCLLHGHVHRRYALTLPGFGPTILCAGSTTERGHEGAWLLEIEGGRASAEALRYDASYLRTGYLRTGERIPLS